VDREKLTVYLEQLEKAFRDFLRRLHLELGKNMVTDITPNQFIVMKQIHDAGQMTVSEVAEQLGVSLSAVTSQVDRLYAGGFVERGRDDKDRRLVWLRLTQKGLEMVKKCLESRLRVVERYFGQLPEEDLEKLMEICTKVLEVMRQKEHNSGIPGGG